MAATPPPRSPIECPGAPLWPAKYEQPHEVRRSTRIAAAGQKSKGEPSTPRRDHRITPPPTAKKDKSTAGRNLFGGNAPQTPMKKKSAMPATPVSVAKSAKAASLISKFSLDQRSDNPITIFEDSNARLPEAIGDHEDDIFKTEKESKRRKVTISDEFVPPTSEGMFVVQRGRRMWKAFEETSVFEGPPPRKNLFANYPKVSKAKAQAQAQVQAEVPMPEDTLPPLATDDEETEREDSPEPSTRIVRFQEAGIKASPSASTVSTSTTTRSVATPKKPRTPRHAKKGIDIDTAFMTPPETLGRVHTIDIGDTGNSSRTAVKRKLSYAAAGLATPEATPAKKRGKAASGAPIPRTDDPFASSPTRTRRGSGKSRV
ncbi:hypothetical protein TWF730_009921 [Orbilia blumenaviensis]|uniref:Uncharacterized protein n=1 Tax=Orbilia blumenaviensis TaxID=1796055 RepID=A0AAV9UT67_9PEZI